ncbi:YicC/YloC family endoribonuclease [Hyphomonas sp. FCG-A18]|uniref:YicC/YloC family endoribonuclease n=1 Tax=Hyphomonas sp. FCG-A18 TaxID=3080019 RepID=UPI002B29660C|nr:YicC/YloC family endoribonuclease [Hyphomonas sp. FCG-A18]
MATVSSMTGFARTGGQASFGTFTLEAKSVNGKGMDIRLNLPREFQGLETRIKSRLSQRFSRGSFQVSLKYERSQGAVGVHINPDALKALIDAYEQADGQLATGTALATLMTAKGVLEDTAGDLEVTKSDEEIILAAIDVVFQALDEARREEGEKLGSLLSAQVSEIANFVAQARTFADDQIAQVRKRFEGKLAEFDVEGRVDAERLAAEVAVLLTKADVTEELDRLDAHVVSARAMLEAENAIGRKLGFLAQEFHREANTLCAKSASLELTNCGLALKSVIDQFKEQSANVE